MTRATNGNRWQQLSVRQENAIDLLITGKTDIEVAETVGVNRVTVTKWRNYHPGFQAELNRRRHNLWGSAAERLRSLVPKALDVVADELDKGSDKFRVAVQVLKLAGLDQFEPPTGPADPDTILDEQVQVKTEIMAAESRKYRSTTETLMELDDPSFAKTRDEAVAQAARESVIAEVNEGLSGADE